MCHFNSCPVEQRTRTGGKTSPHSASSDLRGAEGVQDSRKEWGETEYWDNDDHTDPKKVYRKLDKQMLLVEFILRWKEFLVDEST